MAAPILMAGGADALALQMWLEQAEQRLAQLETPQGPTPVYACTKANLPTAASFINCIVRITDLDILAHSNGVNWLREDTGAIA